MTRSILIAILLFVMCLVQRTEEGLRGIGFLSARPTSQRLAALQAGPLLNGQSRSTGGHGRSKLTLGHSQVVPSQTLCRPQLRHQLSILPSLLDTVETSMTKRCGVCCLF